MPVDLAVIAEPREASRLVHEDERMTGAVAQGDHRLERQVGPDNDEPVGLAAIGRERHRPALDLRRSRPPGRIEGQTQAGRSMELERFALDREVVGRTHHRLRGQHVERIHVLDEFGHVIVGRPQQDVGGGAELYDVPALHDGDAVADLQRLRQVVADKDDGLVKFALQIEQIVLELVADQRIQGGERLIHQQDVGVGGERAGEADALLHAAGQFLHGLVGPARQPDHGELLVDDAGALRSAHAAQFEPEADIVAHAAPGQQAELLEHHRNGVEPNVAQGGGSARRHVDRLAAVMHEDAAAGDAVQAVDRPEHGRLARTRQAHQHADLTAADVEIDLEGAHEGADLLADVLAPSPRSDRASALAMLRPKTMSTFRNSTAFSALSAATSGVAASRSKAFKGATVIG